MGVNQAEQGLNDRLVTQIADLTSQMEALKTRQFVSSDNLVVLQNNAASLSTTIATGTSLTWNIFWTYTSHPTYWMSEFGTVVYLTNYGNPAYRWPNGSSVTGTEQHGIRFDIAYAADLSTEFLDGKKAYKMTVHNDTGSTKTIYVDVTLLYPKF